MEAHQRALATPGFRYAIIGLSNPDLEKNHLGFIQDEMKKFGPPNKSYFHQTKKIAYYPNGSIGFYSHCSNNGDGLGNMLGAEVYWLGIDELCSVDWDLFRKIAVSCRVPKKMVGLKAMIRGATNPAGLSVDKVYQYFIDKNPENAPNYNPGDWHHIHTVCADNPHLSADEYAKMFSGLPPSRSDFLANSRTPPKIRRRWATLPDLDFSRYQRDDRCVVSGGGECHALNRARPVLRKNLVFPRHLRLKRKCNIGVQRD